MKTILIGDIHGCFRELTVLLEKLRFDAMQDELISLGDLMDRGPDSYEVFRWVVAQKKQIPGRMTIIRGSHEKMLLDAPSSISSNLLWNLVGKKAAVRSFRRYHAQLLSCREWIVENTIPYCVRENFQCVHAGIRYENPSDNDDHTLMMDHSITKKNRYSGKLTITGHIYLKKPTYFDGSGSEGTVLPYDRWLELPTHGVICLDTSCAEGNKLTGMVVQKGQYCLTGIEKSTDDKEKCYRRI